MRVRFLQSQRSEINSRLGHLFLQIRHNRRPRLKKNRTSLWTARSPLTNPKGSAKVPQELEPPLRHQTPRLLWVPLLLKPRTRRRKLNSSNKKRRKNQRRLQRPRLNSTD